MPTATRTFRVFVSSTFEDLKAERDALQREVFPRLRTLCEQNNARFQAIDLRWGVRDEAALDQQTMEICLREIERCQQTGIKPNFIVLLGERYGWRPLPARIEAGEFEQILSVASEEEKRRLKFEEGQPNRNGGWYRRDDNADPAEYILRPREVNVAQDASEADRRPAQDLEADAWEHTENDLRDILSSAIARLGWPSDDPRRFKYEASATHQEILKGLGRSEEDGRHVFAFFREAAKGVTEDPEITKLKQELSGKLPEGNVLPFSASDLARLCTDVETKLSAVILSEADRFKPQHALDLEIAEHLAFARDRANHFRGRVGVLDAIKKHICSGEICPLVVQGPSGCGKSAIMARAAKLAEDWTPDAALIERFIGVTPDSSNGITLLTSLCQRLSRVYGVTEETPIGFQPLVLAFHERMARATAGRPLVVFLDALDQLPSDDEVRSFTWLRQNLPPHVSLILSATEIPAGLTHAAQVEVEDFCVEEADDVLAAWFAAARPERKLQSGQREKVLGSFARSESRLPLYLKLAFEEARRWRSFEPLEKCALGSDVGGMIDVLFNRLSEEANHGPVLVNRSLGFLAAARYGLSEDEMLDVLTADDAVWQDFESRAHHKPPARQLPVIVWSRLFLDLEPYLNERAAPGGTVIAFYHRQLAERVTAKFLGEDERQARHGDLARHFYARPPWLDEGQKTPNARRAAELVFQQREAGQWVEAEATLFDCAFLFSKVAAGMVLDLDNDYQAVFKNAAVSELHFRDDLQLLQATLRLSMHVVAKDRNQFASQMRGRLLAYLARPGIADFLDRLDACTPRPRLRPLLPALEAAGGAAHRVLEGHSGWVYAVAVTPDGRYAVSGSVSWDKTLRVWDLEGQQPPRVLEGHSDAVFTMAITPDGRRVVSGSGDMSGNAYLRDLTGASDYSVKVSDLQGHQPPRVLEGHSGWVWAVAVMPDGRHAVSGSEDKTLRVWDLVGNQPPRVLEGHSDQVYAVALTPDGRHVISGSDDKTLRVWDLKGNKPPRVLKGHSNRVMAVAVTPDGRHAISGSYDNTLRVWDLEGNHPPRVLEGHSWWVNAVVVTPDCRHAVSASYDNTLRVWDLKGNKPPRVLKGHSNRVMAVAVTPDGRYAVSGSYDKTLRVWDLEGHQPPRGFEGHSDRVNCLAVTPDGRLAVSGSDDKTLRVWDLEGSKPPHVLEGHSGWVWAVAVTPDGRHAVSGSWDKTLRVWDLKGNKPPRVLEGQLSEVIAVAVTPDGRHVVSGSFDHILRVWDLQGSKPPRGLEGHTDRVNCVAVTPDGRLAVSGSGDHSLRLWDLEGKQPPRVLRGHWDPVRSVALTPDGRRAVSGSDDNTLLVWDLEDHQPPRMLEAHSDSVWAVTVTPDGRHAVSCSEDKTLRVWDLSLSKCVVVFTCDAPVLCCACAETRIVAGDSNGQVHLFAWEE